MKLFRAMWLAESLDSERQKLIRRAEKGRFSSGVYAVALPEHGDDILEILPGIELNEPYYRRSQQMILGLAASKDEAVELSGGIIARVLKETGTLNVAAYIEAAEERL